MTRQSLAEQVLPFWEEAKEIVFGLMPPPNRHTWDDLVKIIKVLKAFTSLERNSRIELLQVSFPRNTFVGLRQVFSFKEEGCILLNGVYVVKPGKLHYVGPADHNKARFQLELLPLVRLTSESEVTDGVEEFCEIDGKYYGRDHYDTRVHPEDGRDLSISEAKLRVCIQRGTLEFVGSLTQPRVAVA